MRSRRCRPACTADLNRERYERDLRGAPRTFFRRVARTCPWCAGGATVARIRLTDTRQCKPGSFVMHRCPRCGHVFQNPMLTDAGLDYYYRDLYDGLGAEHYATVARYARGAHRERIQWALRTGVPATWLDVGARHGHLCREGRLLLPGTVFTAQDPGSEIEPACGRGWVDEAVRAPLVEIARSGSRRFDVISMIHYLERRPEPTAELDAACTLLADGGVLLVEAVNPESAFARLYGRYWYGWMAPQNLHLLPWRNLCRALESRGLRLVDVELGRANKPFDTVAALLTLLHSTLPPARRWPWIERDVPRRARVLRSAVMTACIPLVGLALVLDRLAHLVTVRGSGGNTYRILAARA